MDILEEAEIDPQTDQIWPQSNFQWQVPLHLPLLSACLFVIVEELASMGNVGLHSETYLTSLQF